MSARRSRREGLRRAASLLLGATLAVATGSLGVGCGEDTPEFGDLAQPSEEEAVPLESEQLRKTPEERAASQAEAAQRMEEREHQDLPGAQPEPEEPETAPVQ